MTKSEIMRSDIGAPARGAIPGLAQMPARGMALAAKPLAPGIYFNLSAERYHQDGALGSSDIRLIRKDPQRFWKQSAAMNPAGAHLYKNETKATALGTALHCLVLDGEAKFRDRYVRRPDDHSGATPAEKSAITKAAKAKLLSHQTLLHADDWNLCINTEELIVEHPDLKDALAGGENEVSVFWDWNGVRCKARFDRLKPGGLGDIKTIENERDSPLKIAAMYAIKSYRYDIQAGHYMEARAAMRKLAQDNQIYSVNVAGEPELSSKSDIVAAKGHLALALECAKRDVWGFQFVFIQKSFPAVWSCKLSPGNPILETGREHAEQGVMIYVEMLAKHGTKKWPATWRLEELAIEEMPGQEWGWV
jgi:hypothetical protein